MKTVSTRYSEADLAEFKALVEKLVDKGMDKLQRLEEDYKEAAETMDDDGDWMDNSSSQNDLGMLQTLVSRQRKHVNDLQNALQRIHNKSFGICVVTGELIDKRRLLVVPTTTKSVAAKNMLANPPKQATKPINDDEDDDEEDAPKPKVKEKKEPVIITRIIKKPTAAPVVVDDDDEEEDDDDLDDIYDENAEEEFDFDSVADDGESEDDY